MAPKTAALTLAPTAATGPSPLVPLSRISQGQDSGWRTTRRTRVDELKATFRAGNFGQTALSEIQLLTKTDADDRYLVDDGLASSTALIELEDEWNNDATEAEWPANLIRIFTTGLSPKWVEYSDDSLPVRKIWNMSKHDVDNNKYRQTGVRDAIDGASEWVALHGVNAKTEIQRVLGSGQESRT